MDFKWLVAVVFAILVLAVYFREDLAKMGPVNDGSKAKDLDTMEKK